MVSRLPPASTLSRLRRSGKQLLLLHRHQDLHTDIKIALSNPLKREALERYQGTEYKAFTILNAEAVLKCKIALFCRGES